MNTVIIKGNESDNGFNPFHYFKGALKENTILIFENLGLKYELEESNYPTIEFKKLRSGLWDVNLTAPAFQSDGSFDIVKRHVKGITGFAASILYGMVKCGHGDSEDSMKIKSRFSSNNMTALKMVPHALYTSGFGKEGWHTTWDFSFTNMIPTYYKRIGWVGNYTTLKRLLNNFGETYRMSEKRIVQNGRETRWTNYELDNSHFEKLQKDLYSLIPNARCNDQIEVNSEHYSVESDRVKVNIMFNPDNDAYRIEIRNRRGTVAEAWVGSDKQEFDRDEHDIIKYFTETSWEEALDELD